MDPSTLLAYVAVSALLTITPGADMALVTRNSLAGGRVAGMWTGFGSCTGLFVHAAMSGLGLSLILAQSAAAFRTVKLIGAAYLVFLGAAALWEAWRGRSSVAMPGAPPPRALSGPRALTQGLVSNIFNPKVALFYLAFLPQFIAPSDPVLWTSLFLGGVHALLGVVWLSGLAWSVAKARDVLGRPSLRRRIEAATGAILVVFGLRLATTD